MPLITLMMVMLLVFLQDILYEGNDLEVYVHNGCEIHIKENRDYFNNTERINYTSYIYPHPYIDK